MHGLSLTGNVAYGKPTNQSGDWGGLTSERGVDGYLGTADFSTKIIGNKYCAHPDHPNGERAWFYVDLEKMHQIYNVTVFNTYTVGKDFQRGGRERLNDETMMLVLQIIIF